jgi:hypothetical protein
MGAATHGLKTQRFVATVPIKVAMDAPCTIILVKQSLPFELLGDNGSGEASDSAPAGGKTLDTPTPDLTLEENRT